MYGRMYCQCALPSSWYQTIVCLVLSRQSCRGATNPPPIIHPQGNCYGYILQTQTRSRRFHMIPHMLTFYFPPPLCLYCDVRSDRETNKKRKAISVLGKRNREMIKKKYKRKMTCIQQWYLTKQPFLIYAVQWHSPLNATTVLYVSIVCNISSHVRHRHLLEYGMTWDKWEGSL